jgi:hypothetical protein
MGVLASLRLLFAKHRVNERYGDITTVEALFVGGWEYQLDLFPELALANDFAVVTGAVFVVLVVPRMVCTACLAIFAFIYPPTDRTWQYPSQICAPSIRMLPAKWNIKNHVAAPVACFSQ